MPRSSSPSVAFGPYCLPVTGVAPGGAPNPGPAGLAMDGGGTSGPDGSGLDTPPPGKPAAGVLILPPPNCALAGAGGPPFSPCAGVVGGMYGFTAWPAAVMPAIGCCTYPPYE